MAAFCGTCPLQNIAMPESVTTGQMDRQTDGQTNAGQSDPYASQATQKWNAQRVLNIVWTQYTIKDFLLSKYGLIFTEFDCIDWGGAETIFTE